MKVISKTLSRIVIEITSQELNKKGFDCIWDDIREIYPENIYETEKIKQTNQGKVMTIVLKRKHVLGSFF